MQLRDGIHRGFALKLKSNCLLSPCLLAEGSTLELNILALLLRPIERAIMCMNPF